MVVCVTQCREAFVASKSCTAKAELLNVVRVNVISVHHSVQLILVSVHIHLRTGQAEETDDNGEQ